MDGTKTAEDEKTAVSSFGTRVCPFLPANENFQVLGSWQEFCVPALAATVCLVIGLCIPFPAGRD